MKLSQSARGHFLMPIEIGGHLNYLKITSFHRGCEIIWKAICGWLMWRADIVLGCELSSGKTIYQFPLFSSCTTTQSVGSALPRAWTNYAKFIIGFQGPRVLKNFKKKFLYAIIIMSSFTGMVYSYICAWYLSAEPVYCISDT